MVSKEIFVRTMESLKAMSDKIDDVDNALRKLSPDFGGFYIADAFYIPIGLLEEILNDKESGWISYCVWERNWLRDMKLGDVTMDGEPIDLSNWGKVYDFLVSNMQ